MGKKKKRVHYSFVFYEGANCLIKALLGKTQWDKSLVKEKEYSACSPPYKYAPPQNDMDASKINNNFL